MILQLNGIECKEKDLNESPKNLDYGVVVNMRYYNNSDDDYYYLEDSGRQIYDDKILEKEVTEMTCQSNVGDSVAISTSVDVKALLMICLRSFLQITRPGRIISWHALTRFPMLVRKTW